jgi:C-terminal processing protease CtpA/Prc
MSSEALAQLYTDLDTENQSREGVVIDIRDNNGGFIDPYVADVIQRRDYLRFNPRGGVSSTGTRADLGQRALGRKTVLVTNEHSLSDAENFTEGYRALHLGKVVGEPTAGWIIFTYGTQLIDGTSYRLPNTAVTALDGSPLERHPRPVDVRVARPLGESGSDDAQLRAAVETLLRR